MKINKFDLIKTEVIRNLNTAHYAYGVSGEDDGYNACVWACVAATDFATLLAIVDTAKDLRIGQVKALEESKAVNHRTAMRECQRALDWARKIRVLAG